MKHFCNYEKKRLKLEQLKCNYETNFKCPFKMCPVDFTYDLTKKHTRCS